MQQHTKQGIPVTLAAGKHADALESIVRRKQKAAKKTAQLGLRRAGRDFAEIIKYACVGVELLVLILRKVVGVYIVTQSVFALRHGLRSS